MDVYRGRTDRYIIYIKFVKDEDSIFLYIVQGKVTMAKFQKERIHPETGQRLIRSERELTISYRGMKKTINMPGWYSPDDTTGESGLHSSKDMRVSDRALNEISESQNHVLQE